MPQRIELSTRTFLEILGVLAFLALAYLIRDILLLLFISIILMSAGNPVVDKFEKAKLPRWVGILFLYLLSGLFLGITFALIIPPLVSQTNDFLFRLPAFIDKAIIELNLADVIDIVDLHILVQNLLKDFSRDIAQTPIHILRLGADVFGRFLNIVSIGVFTFYLLVEHRKLKRLVTVFFPQPKREKVRRLIENVETKLGAWLRGRIALSFIVGLFVWIGLTLLRVNFALPLAVLAGILEIIPLLGPIIALTPALIIALAVSPLKALSVLVLYIFIQQAENNLIAPQVMKGAVGLDPLMVILALLIGGRLAGPLGALLAVPFTVVLLIFASNLLPQEK